MNVTPDNSDAQGSNSQVDAGQQTPLKGSERKTGKGTSMDTRDGAAPEAPGARSETPGAPNQGTGT
ncbi:MAG: hypothetical protein HC824_02740 [Synechococcales cyanobacterium RM1_1_8]|nr:hypothetical protein [Synechococcales cyanobacterium RM1_1_8]